MNEEPATAAKKVDSRKNGCFARVGAVVRLMRPVQWTKNAVVLIPAFFAAWDRYQNDGILSRQYVMLAIWATASFCLMSSAVYALNDILDAESDRNHPEKCRRPIASGEIGGLSATFIAVALFAASFAIAIALVPGFGFVRVLGGYAALQIFYSSVGKRVCILDVMMIASGFVLRAVAGAVAVHVHISPWLLLCGFLLALLLAFCKRRSEMMALGDKAGEHRRSLDAYDAHALDRYIAITASSTIVCYAMYTLSPITIAKFGTEKLVFTVVFVIFGIFHYLNLLYREGKGGQPEKILVSDLPLIITIILYFISALVIFKWSAIAAFFEV